MTRRRFQWPLFLAFLLGSIAVTILLNILLPGAWFLGGLILFLPFFFIGGAGDDEDAVPTRCPACGYTQREPTESYCPRDGTRLANPPRPRSDRRV